MMADDKKPFIFIDTCSLLDSCWNNSRNDRDHYEYSQAKDDMFWGREFVSLANIGDVIIPKRNYDELVKHSKKTSNRDLASRSQHVLKRIEKLYRQGTLQIVGDPNDPFADAILLSVALKFKTQRHLAFVTQDRGLAEDLQAISYFRSLSDHYGHPRYDLKVRRISESGELEPFKGLEKALKERYAEVADNSNRATKTGSAKPSGKAKKAKQPDEPVKTTPRKSWWEA